MRIGIDAYPLARPTKAGISYHAYYMIKNILEQDNGNEYFLYKNSRGDIDLNFPNLHYPPCSGYDPINKFSTGWMLFNAARDLARDKIDLFWGTQGIIPPNLPKSIKSIVTTCDLTYYLFPRTMAFDNYFIYKFLFRRSLINAKKIIAISQATADDLRRVFKAKQSISEKIDVIHCGIDTDRFKPLEKEKSKEYIAAKFDTINNYMLFVGTIEPRKNIPALLEAFKVLKTRYGVQHQLIFAGAKGWRDVGIYKVYQSLAFKEDDVKFLGYVSEGDLGKLYSGADLFVMPSLYEGFGMPPLEAMACGTPVAASGIPVFRESLADAALFFDPASPDDIAKESYAILNDKQLRDTLIAKGFQQSKSFSWRESGEKMLRAFSQVFGEGRKKPC